MIVLDTNVISELMRPAPSLVVIDWVDQQIATDLHLASTTVAELLYGIARLPVGSRRSNLADQVEVMITTDFQQRVLPFDLTAAPHYADIAAARATAGRPIGAADAQIAATCRSHGATLATRSTKDFDDTGITIINPWKHTPVG
ncbi:MAG: type II toxin-antitoxin system VapC family toxin [Acidimicrobiales bacterium]